MSSENCAIVRELIPEFVINRLGEDELGLVESHISDCFSCREEFELVERIFASRPEVPGTLEESVTRVVIDDLKFSFYRWQWQALSAAAIAALALGIGISLDSPRNAAHNVPDFAHEIEEGGIWLTDDAFVAGAPSFDNLSDEALADLIEELSVVTSGGTA